uniref:Uncharacterized protein n=1 Tax=Romanomermis culicivorax TaxID=13658 RepID=A0A915J1P9_ROMCU
MQQKSEKIRQHEMTKPREPNCFSQSEKKCGRVRSNKIYVWTLQKCERRGDVFVTDLRKCRSKTIVKRQESLCRSQPNSPVCQKFQCPTSTSHVAPGAPCDWVSAPLEPYTTSPNYFLQCNPSPGTSGCGVWNQMQCSNGTVFSMFVQICVTVTISQASCPLGEIGMFPCGTDNWCPTGAQCRDGVCCQSAVAPSPQPLVPDGYPAPPTLYPQSQTTTTQAAGGYFTQPPNIYLPQPQPGMPLPSMPQPQPSLPQPPGPPGAQPLSQPFPQPPSPPGYPQSQTYPGQPILPGFLLKTKWEFQNQKKWKKATIAVIELTNKSYKKTESGAPQPVQPGYPQPPMPSSPGYSQATFSQQSQSQPGFFSQIQSPNAYPQPPSPPSFPRPQGQYPQPPVYPQQPQSQGFPPNIFPQPAGSAPVYPQQPYYPQQPSWPGSSYPVPPAPGYPQPFTNPPPTLYPLISNGPDAYFSTPRNLREELYNILS